MTNFATTSILPLLARLVVAAAMLTSGWMNCFGQVEISHAMASQLRAMEIEVVSPTAQTLPPSTVGDPADAMEESSTPTTTFDTTRGVHRIVWLVHQKWPDIGGWGIFVSWTAAVCQLAAGLLLLVGLFTRLSALTICVASGMAIYLVSGGIHGMFTMNPFDWPQDSHRFIQLFAGLGLFTLSLGLLASGGGGFSLDARHKNTALPAKSNSVKNRSE
ncbi:MAG: DoxX family membrane protein [Planctomycetes bacterium]|nr:DoxX family membrane protein [Planctomycetota bacterium]